MLDFFKKKTRKELLQDRTDNVYMALTNSNEFECTELETIQVLNSVRRMLSDALETKKGDLFEQSVFSNHKAKEIENALKYLE